MIYLVIFFSLGGLFAILGIIYVVFFEKNLKDKEV